ncbi:hypothetical protein C8R44DRAFT_809376, partial [Mycena epipterygia]
EPLLADLGTVDTTSLVNLSMMHEEVESAETDSEPQIGAASRAAGGSRFVLLPPYPSSCSILRFHFCSASPR